MKLIYGRNRRQLPLELLTPGGRIVISRAPHGTIEVKIFADSGEVQLDPGSRPWATTLRLLHERREES